MRLKVVEEHREAHIVDKKGNIVETYPLPKKKVAREATLRNLKKQYEPEGPLQFSVSYVGENDEELINDVLTVED